MSGSAGITGCPTVRWGGANLEKVHLKINHRVTFCGISGKIHAKFSAILVKSCFICNVILLGGVFGNFLTILAI